MGRTLKEKIIKSVEHVKENGMGEFLSAKVLRYSQRLERSFGLLSAPMLVKKRILGIWDYRYCAWALGDSLAFSEVLSCQKLKYGAEAIDICVIYDRDNPGRDIDIYSHITKETAQDYAFEYLPLLGMCLSLGTVYYFNSRLEFHHFLKMNARRYVVYPENFSTFEEPYFTKYCLDGIEDFYKQNKYIPSLVVGGKYLSWVKDFYASHLMPGEVPVVISLRKSSWTVERNANLPTWLSFIDKVKISFPEVKFIIVGKREEIVPELEERKDVLIAKKFGTSMMEDCALVRTGAMYMGLDSGIHAHALYSDQPYIVCQGNSHERWSLPEEKGFCFSTDLQRYFSVKIPVTAEFLFKQFSEIYPKAKVRLKAPVWKRS